MYQRNFVSIYLHNWKAQKEIRSICHYVCLFQIFSKILSKYDLYRASRNILSKFKTKNLLKYYLK